MDQLGGDADVAVTPEAAGDLASLCDHLALDPERFRLEVVDAVAGEHERDHTIKRFPTWGDAAHLIDMLDVRRSGDLAWVSVARTDGLRPVVEGSQMLGQSIVAAGRHAPDRRVVSAHMLFLRGADAARPLDFELTELSAGRSFTGLAAQVLQGGRCRAAGTLLLGTLAPDVVQHQAAAPDVPGPYECPPFDMGVTGRDLRVVDGAYTNDSTAPIGPPLVDAWVRFRDVPDDPALHAGLLAQFTGHMPIAAALRPHEGIGQDQAHRTLSMGINAINISFHRRVRADQWILYRHLSTFAGDGMTRAECRAHDEDGHLVASFTVDAMVRHFGDDRARDDRTAL
jgi:acyl-CoA thioesterase II